MKTLMAMVMMAAAAVALLCLSTAVQATTHPGWKQVYSNDFKTFSSDINAEHSSVSANDQVKASDNSNSQLQKPTIQSNVEVVADQHAHDGHALAVFTRQGSYETSHGLVHGWTNGRLTLAEVYDVPVRLRLAVRFTKSIDAKTAVMFWPTGGGWPWEVDMVETFGGDELNNPSNWGSRQFVTLNWHSDINHDGAAKEQLSHTTHLDATKYHIYDTFITPNRMWLEIDGKEVFSTSDKKWIPSGRGGQFSIGKALTGTRSGAHSEDVVYVDYIEVFTGGSYSGQPATGDAESQAAPSTDAEAASDVPAVESSDAAVDESVPATDVDTNSQLSDSADEQAAGGPSAAGSSDQRGMWIGIGIAVGVAGLVVVAALVAIVVVVVQRMHRRSAGDGGVINEPFTSTTAATGYSRMQ